eukprot:8293204-Alexandrium_andersonii.AAC.1
MARGHRGGSHGGCLTALGGQGEENMHRGPVKRPQHPAIRDPLDPAHVLRGNPTGEPRRKDNAVYRK